MSWVANVLLSVALEDRPTVETFNSWLHDGAPRQGVLNHADLDAVIAQFGATPWKVAAAAQLMIMDQEQSYFRLWMTRDGELRQFAPEPPVDNTAW